MRVNIVEAPAFERPDDDGFNWTAITKGDPLGGEQILAPHLEAAGTQWTQRLVHRPGDDTPEVQGITVFTDGELPGSRHAGG